MSGTLATVTGSAAWRHVVGRLGVESIALNPIILDVEPRPSFADGITSDGRAILLAGRAALGESAAAVDYVAEVLDGLKSGRVLHGCHPVYYAKVASAALVEILDGPTPPDGRTPQYLLWGVRGGGKTVIVPSALLGLAELHLRAGFEGPLRVLHLHPTLQDAATKTGDTLVSAPLAPVWTLRDDKREAVATLAGTELVRVTFVGVQDASASERVARSVTWWRARSSCRPSCRAAVSPRKISRWRSPARGCRRGAGC